MVVIGGEATSDLRDFWALDLENNRWYSPELFFNEFYTPKRFHSVNVIG